MDVLFLRNPKTGEVRRFFARASVPHDIASFEGWDVVDADEWMEANADPAIVEAAVARYHELTANAQPPAAETGARGDDSDDEAEPFELSMQRLIPGLWRVTHKDGVASMELVVEDARGDDSGYTELIDELSGRIKVLERALRPFAAQWAEWIKAENEWVHDPDTAMDIVEFFADYADNDVVAKHLKAAYDALQATGGEVAE